jgi:hypothetical protein
VRWRIVGIVGGVILLIIGILASILGSSPLRAPMLAVAVLLILVAGGNLLNSWMGIERKAQEFNRPDLERHEVDEP